LANIPVADLTALAVNAPEFSFKLCQPLIRRIAPNQLGGKNPTFPPASKTGHFDKMIFA
jgi:hypothetical protein